MESQAQVSSAASPLVKLGSNDPVRDAIAQCEVVLTLIGRSWLDLRDESGTGRLEDPKDFVRIEIAATLQRGIQVVPILLEGAKIPDLAALPDDLRGLALRNGLEVRNISFHKDMDTLIRELKGQPR